MGGTLSRLTSVIELRSLTFVELYKWVQLKNVRGGTKKRINDGTQQT